MLTFKSKNNLMSEMYSRGTFPNKIKSKHDSLSFHLIFQNRKSHGRQKSCMKEHNPMYKTR